MPTQGQHGGEEGEKRTRDVVKEGKGMKNKEHLRILIQYISLFSLRCGLVREVGVGNIPVG